MTLTTYKHNPNNPKKLSKAELKTLDEMKDKDIDYSDIPELDESFLENAIRVSESINKTKISLRLDNDVLAWLKQRGKGYQTRANRILRAAMEHDEQHLSD